MLRPPPTTTCALDVQSLRVLLFRGHDLGGADLLAVLRNGGFAQVLEVHSLAEAAAAVPLGGSCVSVIEANFSDGALDAADCSALLVSRYRMPSLVVLQAGFGDMWTRLTEAPLTRILKTPFSPRELLDSVEACVGIAIMRFQASSASRLLLDSSGHAVRFIRGVGRFLLRIDFADVLYLRADGAYTDVQLVGGRTQVAEGGIRATVRKFRRSDLTQIHKSYAVPFHAIERCYRERVVLVDQTELPIGRTYRLALQAALSA